jgi:hypothetical protein
MGKRETDKTRFKPVPFIRLLRPVGGGLGMVCSCLLWFAMVGDGLERSADALVRLVGSREQEELAMVDGCLKTIVNGAPRPQPPQTTANGAPRPSATANNCQRRTAPFSHRKQLPTARSALHLPPQSQDQLIQFA